MLNWKIFHYQSSVASKTCVTCSLSSIPFSFLVKSFNPAFLLASNFPLWKNFSEVGITPPWILMFFGVSCKSSTLNFYSFENSLKIYGTIMPFVITMCHFQNILKLRLLVSAPFKPLLLKHSIDYALKIWHAYEEALGAFIYVALIFQTNFIPGPIYAGRSSLVIPFRCQTFSSFRAVYPQICWLAS